jgi:hypothetical protein
MDWVGGTMQGPGRTVVNGASFLSGPGAKLLDGRTIDNAGVARWTGGNINGYNGAVWNNLRGSTFDAQSDAFFSASGDVASVFNNAGTVRKSFGSSRTTLGVVFSNDGAVEVLPGQTLALTGGGRSTGTFSIGGGARVNFGSLKYVLATGVTITGDGVAGVTGYGATLLIDGAVTAGHFESAFESPYGGLAIAASGTLLVTTAFDWSAGLLSGPGSLNIAPGAALNIGGAPAKALTGLTINNAGTATWSGTGDIVASQYSVFNNLAGAQFIVLNNQRFNPAAGEPPGSCVFNNAGLFTKTAGGGVTTIGVRFNNTGTVDIRSGSVNFTDQGPPPAPPPGPGAGGRKGTACPGIADAMPLGPIALAGTVPEPAAPAGRAVRDRAGARSAEGGAPDAEAVTAYFQLFDFAGRGPADDRGGS